MEKFLNFMVSNENTISVILILSLVLVIILTLVFSKRPVGDDKKSTSRDYPEVGDRDTDLSGRDERWRPYDHPPRHKMCDDPGRNFRGEL